VVNNNHLTLAVAGSGKTQGIVDACIAAGSGQRILALTYTSANQEELKCRLATQAGDRYNTEVSGWFSFLISHFVRPYLPFAYAGQRIRGFDFKSEPQQKVPNEAWTRYFNRSSEARRVHLAQLAHRVAEAADGAPLRRLERIYDAIYIDEVQDLCGWDLEVLKLLMTSTIPLHMVGDVRQAILVTNNRESKNKQYKFMKVWDWFNAQERARRLTISQECETRRCRPEITELADSLFAPSMGFHSTVSRNVSTTDHDGIFLVKPSDVEAYMQAYEPLLLRRMATSGRELNHLHPMNIGLAKGLQRKHVLVHPTNDIKRLLLKGSRLEEQAAAYLYVAVTRAEQSVAFIVDEPGDCRYTRWSPPDVAPVSR
jgi:DNA helicase II / ATP-dependent DNA helicase PcrA